MPSPFNDNDFELLIVLEKTPDGGPRAQYQVLATTRTGTLQNELKQAQVDGWRVVTLVVRGEVLALLERPEP
jgi:hypothetical protein